jgi:hypothetical protein
MLIDASTVFGLEVNAVNIKYMSLFLYQNAGQIIT